MPRDAGRALPLSHPVRVEGLKLRATNVEVVAPEAALKRIAAELDLASLESLRARYELSRNGERVKLSGTIEARFHQTCVVTLEAFPVSLTVPVSLNFAPEEQVRSLLKQADSGDADEIEIVLSEEDPPEPIVDGIIDLGAVTLEFLALSLDPYPRKPGAAFEEPQADPAADSPFAALARLKRGE